MEKYLETLTSEFRDNYKPLSDKQRGYEAPAEAMVKAFAESKENSEPPELPTVVWNTVSTLQVLSDFIGEDKSYKANSKIPSMTPELLRTELARIVAGTGKAWEVAR